MVNIAMYYLACKLCGVEPSIKLDDVIRVLHYWTTFGVLGHSPIGM